MKDRRSSFQTLRAGSHPALVAISQMRNAKPVCQEVKELEVKRREFNEFTWGFNHFAITAESPLTQLKSNLQLISDTLKEYSCDIIRKAVK